MPKHDPARAKASALRRRAKSIGCTVDELVAHDAAGHWRCPGRLGKVARHWVTDEPPAPFRCGSERYQCSNCRAGRTPT